MPPIYIAYLNRLDIEELKLTEDEILSAIETSLASQGRGEAVIEPRMHLEPGRRQRSFQRAARRVGRRRSAPVSKSSATSSTTTKRGFPSEMGLLLLFDPRHRRAGGDHRCQPDSPTCAPARSPRSVRNISRDNDAAVLGHVGARGTAYWNVRLLDRLFDFDEIRVHSRRPESRDAFAERLEPRSRQAGRRHRRLGSCVGGADIVVEASRLRQPEPLLKTGWIKPGALRGSLRHDERSRALARPTSWTRSSSTTGASARAASSAACARTSMPASCREPTLHAELGRDRRRPQTGSRARRRDDPALASRACRCPTSRSATRCWRRPTAVGSASGCATPEPVRRDAVAAGYYRPPYRLVARRNRASAIRAVLESGRTAPPDLDCKN